MVLVVVVLELLQLGHHGVPASLGNSDGEHDEEGIQAGLFNHHAMFGEIFGHDGGGNPRIGEVTIHVQPRCNNCRLDRVEHVEIRCQLAEAVPAVIRTEHPVISRGHAFFHQIIRPPYLEPPVRAEFCIHLAHGAAEVERFGNGFFHQSSASRRLHHRCGNVARGDDGVLGAGGSVHQIGFVEAVTVEFVGIAFLHQNL